MLERFDGRGWRTTSNAVRYQIPAPRNYRPVPAPDGRTYDYEIILEPHHEQWLLPLETPLTWTTEDARLASTLELVARRPIDRRIAWSGRSLAAGHFVDARTPGPVNRDTAGMRNPRTIALAAELRAAAASDADYLRAVLRLFREQPFHYTLRPPALGTEAVDDFLFRTRSGFCEHFASAFALLARAGGIPARVVAGYQGGELNPVGDYWIVRQSDAHAWTEVWLDGRWIRYDPTAAVAPERIESGLDAALPDASSDTLPFIGDSAWLDRLALNWDAINAAWDRWVLAFGPDQQSALLESLGIRSPSLRDIALACAAMVSLVLLVFVLAGMRAGMARQDPVERAWQQLCARLARRVRPRAPHEGPAEYARTVAALRPDIGTAVLELATAYLRLRYETTPGGEEVRRFAARVTAFRVPPARGPAQAARVRQRRA